jgi:PHD/YefM family antitoxin component YafN of YafNO toxin-antitoxin module
MPTTSTSNFRRRVKEFCEIARPEPVTVTRLGRPWLMLMSALDYERLKRMEQHATTAIKVSKLSKRTIGAMKSAQLSHLPAD